MAKLNIERAKKGIPSIVQKRQDHLSRLQNNPNAPVAGKQYQHESSTAFNRRAGYLERANDQVLDPRRNQGAFRQSELNPQNQEAGMFQKPGWEARRLVDGAVTSNAGMDYRSRELDGRAFFDESDPSQTIAAQRSKLNSMGPEGQATLQLMESQLRKFKQEYAEELARNNRPDMDEEDLARMAQAMDSYDPAMFHDVSQFIQANLPPALKEKRKKKAFAQAQVDATAAASVDNNYQIIKGMYNQEIADEFKASGKSPEEFLGDFAYDQALAGGKGFTEPSGAASIRDPRVVAQEQHVTDMQRAGEIADEQEKRAKKLRDDIAAEKQAQTDWVTRNDEVIRKNTVDAADADFGETHDKSISIDKNGERTTTYTPKRTPTAQKKELTSQEKARKDQEDGLAQSLIDYEDSVSPSMKNGDGSTAPAYINEAGEVQQFADLSEAAARDGGWKLAKPELDRRMRSTLLRRRDEVFAGSGIEPDHQKLIAAILFEGATDEQINSVAGSMGFTDDNNPAGVRMWALRQVGELLMGSSFPEKLPAATDPAFTKLQDDIILKLVQGLN